MPQIVGIRFKRSGKVYYFDPQGLDLQPEDLVVVDTARGSEIGRVVISPREILESEVSEPLKPVVRVAEPKDLRQMEHFKNMEAEVLVKAEAKVAQTGLPMKLLSAEYNFDGSRLTIYFSAESRVDFRDLVRELAAAFRTRIELRQVGVRDETKIIGGLGRCGRVLCCANHLTDFPAVSIKMAKEQDLPLNPMKISGMCGRLLCCLGYENEQYCVMKQKMPKLGEEVRTPAGKGKVASVNVLKEAVLVQLESMATVEVLLTDLGKKGEVEKKAAEPAAESSPPQSKAEESPAQAQQPGSPSRRRRRRR